MVRHIIGTARVDTLAIMPIKFLSSWVVRFEQPVARSWDKNGSFSASHFSLFPQVHPLYMCDASALEKAFNVTKCMVPEHFEKTIFLSAMYTFTVITILLCIAEIFEILCRRLGYLNNQWHKCTDKMTCGKPVWHLICQLHRAPAGYGWTFIKQGANRRPKPHLWSIVSKWH